MQIGRYSGRRQLPPTWAILTAIFVVGVPVVLILSVDRPLGHLAHPVLKDLRTGQIVALPEQPELLVEIAHHPSMTADALGEVCKVNMHAAAALARAGGLRDEDMRTIARMLIARLPDENSAVPVAELLHDWAVNRAAAGAALSMPDQDLCRAAFAVLVLKSPTLDQRCRALWLICRLEGDIDAFKEDSFEGMTDRDVRRVYPSFVADMRLKRAESWRRVQEQVRGAVLVDRDPTGRAQEHSNGFEAVLIDRPLQRGDSPRTAPASPAGDP